MNGTSEAGQTDNLVAHAIYLAVWAASAVLIALGGTGCGSARCWRPGRAS